MLNSWYEAQHQFLSFADFVVKQFQLALLYLPSCPHPLLCCLCIIQEFYKKTKLEELQLKYLQFMKCTSMITVTLHLIDSEILGCAVHLLALIVRGWVICLKLTQLHLVFVIVNTKKSN